MALERAGSPIAAVSVTAPRDRLEGEGAPRVVAAMRRILPGLLPPGLSIAGD